MPSRQAQQPARSTATGQPPDAAALAPFPLLSDPEAYKPHSFDYVLSRKEPGKPTLADWLGVFRKSVPQFQRMAAADTAAIPDSQQREAAVQRFVDSYEALLRRIEADPTASLPGFEAQPVTCISLAALRDRCLREQGFADCFAAVKASESAAALALLPGVIGELDDVADHRARMESALRGVFAGNIFDLGAAASSELFNQQHGVPFRETKAGLLERPWAVDTLDVALNVLTAQQPYHKALIFVDNAGSDVVLGVLPFARELLRNGTLVTLAANEIASINDVTAAELRDLVRQAAQVDATFGRAVLEEMLQVVSTGTDMCVIDLSKVGPELAAATADVDLVVLEGMGRAIETNLYASLTVDILRLGMIKHPEVAAELDGRLYDCVCKFDRGTS